MWRIALSVHFKAIQHLWAARGSLAHDVLLFFTKYMVNCNLFAFQFCLRTYVGRRYIRRNWSMSQTDCIAAIKFKGKNNIRSDPNLASRSRNETFMEYELVGFKYCASCFFFQTWIWMHHCINLPPSHTISAYRVHPAIDSGPWNLYCVRCLFRGMLVSCLVSIFPDYCLQKKL